MVFLSVFEDRSPSPNASLGRKHASGFDNSATVENVGRLCIKFEVAIKVVYSNSGRARE
jgi:hypothetical protein